AFDLFGVRLADSGDLIGKNQPPLEQTEIPVVFQPVDGEQFLPQSGDVPLPPTVDSLESEVVYCQKTVNVDEPRPVAVFVLEQHGHEARLPIVDMDAIDGKIEDLNGVERCPAEPGEAGTVVGVVAALRAGVQPGAIEEL